MRNVPVRWLYKVMIMPLSLVSALLFPGCVVGDPAPSGSSKRVFPLEIFDYPEMPASKVHYEAGGDGFDEYVGFATPEGMSCRVVGEIYRGDVTCDGHYEDYIPWNAYVKHMHDPATVHSPGKCVGYSIQGYFYDDFPDRNTNFDGDVDCHEKIWETGRLDPGYKITFYGSVCGLTKDHVLACVTYDAHGLVLKPHHQSWAF